MERWTRLVLRFRWPILAGWVVVLLAGGFAFTHLSSLLSNEFSVPGTDAERARTILERHFGDRSDGAFTVVFRLRDGVDRAAYVRLQRDVDRAARVVPDSTPRQLVPAGRHILYGDVVSTVSTAQHRASTDDRTRTVLHGGGVQSYVPGQAAIQHDLDPIFSKDLRKGEMIALPIAVVVLLAVFGLSVAVTMPFIFAACTVMATLAGVYVYAHFLTTATYVTNLVFLIGLGIAIDYSLLVTYRFREELTRRADVGAAVVRTMQTAGRAVIFSGATVAIGLALLLFIPLPFVRSIGVGGFLIPLASIAAALTLQPALLSIYGRRGVGRIRVLPERFGPRDAGDGFLHRLAGAIMRRPLAFLGVGAALLVAAAIPVSQLKLTPGSASGIPQFPQSVQGFDVLKHSIGPGATSPTQVVVDSGRPGGVRAPEVQAAIGRLAERIRADRETASLRVEPRPPFVDGSARYEELIVAGHDEYGSEAAQSFVHRLRGKLVPAAGFPSGVRVLAGGGAPQGAGFLDPAYPHFPPPPAAGRGLTHFPLVPAPPSPP